MGYRIKWVQKKEKHKSDCFRCLYIYIYISSEIMLYNGNYTFCCYLNLQWNILYVKLNSWYKYLFKIKWEAHDQQMWRLLICHVYREETESTMKNLKCHNLKIIIKKRGYQYLVKNMLANVSKDLNDAFNSVNNCFYILGQVI